MSINFRTGGAILAIILFYLSGTVLIFIGGFVCANWAEKLLYISIGLLYGLVGRGLLLGKLRIFAIAFITLEFLCFISILFLISTEGSNAELIIGTSAALIYIYMMYGLTSNEFKMQCEAVKDKTRPSHSLIIKKLTGITFPKSATNPIQSAPKSSMETQMDIRPRVESHSELTTMPLWDGQYTGETIEGDDGNLIAHGIGDYTCEGIEYTGEWSNGLPDGEGVEITPEYRAEGTWRNGRRQGTFKIATSEGIEHGEFVDGKKEGIWERGNGEIEIWQNGEIVSSHEAKIVEETDPEEIAYDVDELDAEMIHHHESSAIETDEEEEDQTFTFRFCSSCGSNLSSIPMSVDLCPTCGARIRRGSKNE